jgi:hypothetical protein
LQGRQGIVLIFVIKTAIWLLYFIGNDFTITVPHFFVRAVGVYIPISCQHDPQSTQKEKPNNLSVLFGFFL